MARRKTMITPDTAPPTGPTTLAIDIGGTGLKCSVLDEAGHMMHAKVWQATPRDASPDEMVAELKSMAEHLPRFSRLSAGFPGAIRDGRVVTAPHFPEKHWVGFDLADALSKAFGVPARVLNDAEVQGFGVIRGQGLELVLTLGTGAGTALYENGRLAPHMEFAHHPCHGGKTYNEYVGRDALEKVGKKRWNKRVRKVIDTLFALIHYDHLFIGGGNATHVKGDLPKNVELVSNDAGITGGIALWREPTRPS